MMMMAMAEKHSNDEWSKDEMDDEDDNDGQGKGIGDGGKKDECNEDGEKEGKKKKGSLDRVRICHKLL